MKFTKSGILFLGLSLATGLANAASVTGTLGLSGYVTVTGTQLTFGIDNASSTDMTDNLASVNSGTGSFAGLGRTNLATVNNLIQGPGGVSTTGTFAAVNFIDITTPGGPIEIDLTSLPVTSAPVCTGSGDTNACRPNAASPIVLQQYGTGTLAVLQGSGDAFYTASATSTTPVQVVLSADFGGQSIDSVLGTFAANGGSIGTNYSDNLTVTAVPEPSALAALGLGLVGFGAWKKRKTAK